MNDREILRKLAGEYAKYAFSDRNQEKIKLHRAVNDLKMIRPIVLIDEIPWWELAKEEELILRFQDKDFRNVESMLRQNLYKLKYMPADFAVPEYIEIPKIIHSTGIGVEVQEEKLGQEQSLVVSQSYHNVFREKGLEMLHAPVITYDEKETIRQWSKIGEVIGDIIPVKMVGEPTGYGLGCKTWDTVATLMGVNDLLINLVEEPEFMHGLAEKLTEIFMSTVEQYAKLDLIDTENLYCHSTAASVTFEEKTASDYTGVNLKKVWGRGLAQIFASVSPAMHDEFDIQYMKKAMEPFGYVYYGCCEPLDHKIDILEQIPNLRKISITPWADINVAAEAIGKKYVVSCKPNPSQLALGRLNKEAVEAELSEIIKACRKNNCSFELVLKDISTVQGNPQCLFEWEQIAMRLLESY